MRKLCMTALVLLLAACSSHGVRCSGRLQPINAPTVPARSGETMDPSVETQP